MQEDLTIANETLAITAIDSSDRNLNYTDRDCPKPPEQLANLPT
jgi:hypothetical protein